MDSVKECLLSQEETSFQEDAQEAVTNLQFPTKSLNKRGFALLKAKGTKVYGKSVKFFFFLGSFEGVEFGVTAYKKGGNAVARNYFKRIAKEVFRKKRHLLPMGLKLQVVPFAPLEKISFHTILEDFCERLCTSILSKKEQLKP